MGLVIWFPQISHGHINEGEKVRDLILIGFPLCKLPLHNLRSASVDNRAQFNKQPCSREINPRVNKKME